MHPARKQRLQVVGLIVTAGAIAAALVIYMLGQNANFFYTPSQVSSGEAPVGIFIRAGGMVVNDSLVRQPDSLEATFKVTDGSADLTIRYAGILPDLFAEGEAAIAAGKVDSAGVLQATEVLAKHDENYTPPEVADAMDAAHRAQQQSEAVL
ncbi:cytochrome c maturation protein CcmE [Porticoccaceae bacterium]|jgi:cytochrome c-type biogenesis protein CcmE|nr:cytochrome c maturation protein CcmE [Porticoccaceae bacterium]MDA8664178.1 cytochrome c maturation protein CcmE [Porticoccaceae bacterium]MDA8681933.1 cytochrome c maturation protein CcmE [Porticoccaceae bacterium]MDB2344083.1 cytochrome c maturation protein CcmE [Porticoccaceae bacterium]MDB2663982.1 cytochrome c maturation protein CcmE [Porticoccaceae bacterium]